MSAKKPLTWNPLDSVGRAVDRFIDKPVVTDDTQAEKKKVGRPRAVGRQRIVLYLEEEQVVNLKTRAIKERTDASSIVRRVLKESGF
jgi:hypothetical protein